jgi:hypothetical protein
MVHLKWPSDFPGECPPKSSWPANGSYFYIVKNDPPLLTDFVPQYHLDRKRAEKNVAQKRATLCETMGFSVFTDHDEVIRVAQRHRKIGNVVARLDLEPLSGHVDKPPRPNETTHHTWWKPDGYDPTTVAVVVFNLP